MNEIRNQMQEIKDNIHNHSDIMLFEINKKYRELENKLKQYETI